MKEKVLESIFRGKHCDSNVLIVKIIEVKPKERDILLLDNKGDKYYFDEHPYQGEVVLCGAGLEIGGVKVEAGNRVYLDGALSQGNMLLLGGVVYGRFYKQNIMLLDKDYIGTVSTVDSVKVKNYDLEVIN
jgi:hypothetical protein